MTRSPSWTEPGDDPPDGDLALLVDDVDDGPGLGLDDRRRRGPRRRPRAGRPTIRTLTYSPGRSLPPGLGIRALARKVEVVSSTMLSMK